MVENSFIEVRNSVDFQPSKMKALIIIVMLPFILSFGAKGYIKGS